MRRVAKTLVLAGATAAVALALAEILAWILFWVLTGQPFSWSEMQARRRAIGEEFVPFGEPDHGVPAVVVHPYIGHVRNPDRIPDITEFGHPKGTVIPSHVSRDRVVIAVFGGSVATHFATEGLPHVIELVRDLPVFAGRHFEVLNFAGGGYKQPQQLMMLNYLLVLGSQFDIAINVDGFNEVALHAAENGPKGVFPIYPRGWYRLSGQLADPVLMAIQGELVHQQDQMAEWADLFSSTPLRHLVTANIVWLARQRKLRERHVATLEEFQQYEPDEKSYQRTGPRVEFADETALYRHLVDIWLRSSIQMHNLARANGIAYFHFLQPNQYVPDSKPLSDEEREIAYRESHIYRPGVERGYPLLRAAGDRLRRAGVAFTDLTEIFLDEPRSVYRDDCCHLNALGQRLMAEAVARSIRQAFGAGSDVSADASPASAPRE